MIGIALFVLVFSFGTKVHAMTDMDFNSPEDTAKQLEIYNNLGKATKITGLQQKNYIIYFANKKLGSVGTITGLNSNPVRVFYYKGTALGGYTVTAGKTVNSGDDNVKYLIFYPDSDGTLNLGFTMTDNSGQPVVFDKPVVAQAPPTTPTQPTYTASNVGDIGTILAGFFKDCGKYGALIVLAIIAVGVLFVGALWLWKMVKRWTSKI